MMTAVLFRTLSFITLLHATCLAAAVEPLESIARIRTLSPEQAARNLPVSVEARVTYRHPSHPSLIAEDSHEGIFVELPQNAPDGLKVGSKVRIKGITQPGGFLPIIECHQLEFLGEGPPPVPRRIDAAELFSPSLDCQWVEVAAVITGMEGSGSTLVLAAEVSGWTVRLLLPPGEDTRELVAQLMQRPVTVRGVVGSVFNAQRQLTGRHFFITTFDQITPSESVMPEGEPRLCAVNELLRSDTTSQTRVRVRGTVTHAAGDGLYMRGEGGSVFVHTASHGLAPGTRIEAEGFAAVAPFRPVLRATRVTVLNHATAPPPPQSLDLTGENPAAQQAELVTVEAVFQAQREGPGQEIVLQCRWGDWFFEALLPDRTAAHGHWEADTSLRLTGICELTTTHPLPFSQSVNGFRLHLRDADDITILRRPPWWTLRRLLWALGIVGAASLVSLAWIAMLRRRVAEQTEIIGAQIERAAVKDERQRIARELHDTIEQELAGLSVQLRNARQRLNGAPEQAGMSLALAEKMLRHCREEARTSIRDLRCAALEQRGLPGALEELLTPLATEAGAHFHLEVQGRSYGLAGPAEIHLLRIAHEAVVNAARHAAPRVIRVKLAFAADAVTLEVRDDGCGFDTNAPAPRGHFGVLGIRERANKLRAVLTLDSTPGGGTTVRVVVPAEVAARANGHAL